MSKRSAITAPPPGMVEWAPGRWCHPSDPRAGSQQSAPMAEPLRWELHIRVVSEANQRGHWTAKARRAKAQRQAAYAALPAMVATLPLPLVVTLTRCEPRKLDTDNLAGAFKAVRDGVADALGNDDGDPRIEWRYDQRKPERGAAPGIVIEIQRVEG